MKTSSQFYVNSLKKGVLVAIFAVLCAVMVVSCGDSDDGGGSNPTWVDKNNDGFDDNTHEWGSLGSGVYYDDEGYDYQGFNAEDYNRKGWNKDTTITQNLSGELWDSEGKDRNGVMVYVDENGNRVTDGTGHNYLGIDTRGFNEAGVYTTDGRGKMWNPQGYNKANQRVFADDGKGFDEITHEYGAVGSNEFYDDSGHDYLGYDENDFDANGIYRPTGNIWNDDGIMKDGEKYWDSEGYDWQGFNEDGWDRQGYNRDGNDKDGWTRDTTAVPIDYYLLDDPRLDYDNNQAGASGDITGGKNALRMQANAIKTQFSNSVNFKPNTKTQALKDAVIEACDTIIWATASNNIDGHQSSYVIADALFGVSVVNGYHNKGIEDYIIILATGTSRASDFGLLMEAFRTNAYVDYRELSNYKSTSAPARQDLANLYAQISNKNIPVNDNNIVETFYERIAKELSKSFGVHPELIRSLFNQIDAVERFWAVRDNIITAGLQPSTDGVADTTSLMYGISGPRNNQINSFITYPSNGTVLEKD